MSQSPATSLPLETLSPENKAPKSRIANAADALTTVSSIIYAGRDRARFNSKIKGMFDGNAPYDPVKLKQNAQSYRSNVNYRDGKAILSAALVPYYDLFAGSQTYAEVRLHHDNPDDAEYKSRVATEEFDRLLKQYHGFDFNMQGILHDYVAFGRGFAMFPNTWGWHFNRVQFSRIFVPDGSEASVEKQEVVVIREKTQVHKLWEQIEKPKSAEVGWNKKACCEAIRNAMPEERASQTNDTLSYEWVQQRMKDRDIVEGTRCASVPIAHLLIREFDGAITHMMIEEQPRTMSSQSSNGSVGDKSPTPQFLFKKENRFKEMRQALSAFFFETNDGSWNGACGLGHEIYASVEIKTRLLNKIVDNAFLSGGITLQAKDANSLQKTSLVQAGDFNIIPPGYDVQNAQIFVQSEGLIGTNQLLDQTISSNTGIFKAKMEKPQGNPRTAKEVEIQYQNATVLSNSGVSRFYRQTDPFYSELYRRVTSENPLEGDKGDEAEGVREFRKRCLKRGVTLAELKNVEHVRAVRNIGNGSQFQRQQSLERFTPYVPMLTEGGRQAWMQDLVAAEFGQSAVERYIPEREKKLQPNDQQAMALLENAAMKSGAPVAWTPTQNNAIHAVTHLEAMASAAASLQEGANPIDVLAFLETAGAHTQIHVVQLQNDQSRQNEYDILSAELKKIAKFADDLAGQVQQQQEEAAEQQEEMAAAQAQAQAIQGGQDPDTQLKAAQAAFDADLKQKKQDHQIALKQQAHEQKMAAKSQSTQQALAANDLKLAQQIRQQAIQGAAKAKQQKETVPA